MSERIDLPSIRDKDLRAVLDYYGIAHLIDEGNVKCVSCGNDITWENLGAILVENQKLILCCDFSECIEKINRGSKSWQK